MTTTCETPRGADERPSPPALRVGVVFNGNIIEERLINRRGKVTIGSSPRNTIVVPGAALPERTVVFEVGRRGRALVFGDATAGRVNLGDHVLTLDQLRQRRSKLVRPAGDGRLALPLHRATRGKLFLGEVTLLFQLVEAPPTSPKAKLPPSVRGGLMAGMNWVLAASFIGVALVQAAFVIYLRTLDAPAAPDPGVIWPEIEVASPLLDNPFAPKPLDETKLAEEGEEAIKKIKKPLEPKQTKGTRRPGKGRATRPKPCGPACKAKRLALIKRQISRLGVLAVLAHKGKGPGSTVANLIGRGKPSGSTDRAFAKLGGLTVASRGPTLTTRGQPSGPTGPVDIDSLGGRVSGPKDVDTGPGGAPERIPQGSVTPDRKRIRTLLPVDVVAQTIRRGMPAVRTCYQRALKRNRDLTGKLTMRLSINTMGAVIDVIFDRDTVNDPLVTGCIKGYARRWRFPKSKDGTSDVSVPLLLRASQR